MLNFRTVTILFIIACTGFFLLTFSMDISDWWLAAFGIIYLIFLIKGSASISSDFYTTVHCGGITPEKKIAITFDDGPTPFTKDILHTLAAYHVPATFFMIGKHIRGNEDIVKQVISNGHTIGNHTFSHSFFIDLKNTVAFKGELEQTDDAVHGITGKRLKLFRPPYGVTTPALARASKQLDYSLIGWNIRSLDTTTNSEDVIFKRVTEQLKPGAIILFHDTSQKTNAVLKRVLEFAKEQDFIATQLEDLLKINAYR